MLNVMICDENHDFATTLREQIINTYGDQIHSIVYFKNREALEMTLEWNNYYKTVIFMDADFGGDGIAVAKNVKEKNDPVQIIFISNNLKCCTEVYDVEHLYFLKKPIDNNRLATALNIATKKLDSNRNNILPIITKEASYSIPINSIEYLEKERRLINVYENGNKHSFYGKYEDLEKYRKHNRHFWRCHNSYVVNFKYVIAFRDQCFHMKSGAIIPVSRYYSKQVREEYKKFLEKKL